MASNIPAEAQVLGTPTAEYTRSAGRQALNYVLSSILVIGGVAMLLGGLASSLSGSGADAPFIVLGLLWALPGGWWFISALRKRDLRILVFPEGLSYTRSGKTAVIRWDDVEAVWQAVRKVQYTFTVHTCTLRLKDGSRYTFNNALRQVDRLIQTIQQRVTPRILARAREACDAGQTVPFGKLSVSQAGIYRGSALLPWDQVGSIRVNEGIATVKKEGSLFKWTSVPVAEIPNFFAFAALAGGLALGSSDLTLLATSVLGAAQS